jgi:hypothetical protein
MFKRLKNIIVLLLVVSLFTSGSSVAFAAENESISSANIVWNYTIYDSNMQVIKTGTLSDIKPQYTWDDDITLNNNDTVFFVPSTDYRGLYAGKGITMSISYLFNKSAYHEGAIIGYSSGIDSGYDNYITASSFSGKFTTKEPDYYYGMITNYSSDPIIIKSFSITF